MSRRARYLGIGVVALAAVLVVQEIGRRPPGMCSGKNCTRVLFIGNSLTSVNDLPRTFAKLAGSGHHHVSTAMQAPGGARFADQLASASTDQAIGANKWNIVVLQDQSQQASAAYFQSSELYPSAAELASKARIGGAAPVFYLTPAWRDGWPDNGIPSYQAMQNAIDDGYVTVAQKLHATVAPIGVAWNAEVNAASGPDLWQGDGVHPTIAGTYLAACVLYATVFRESPVGLHWHDGLSADEASTLQVVAADTVLEHGTEWGLANLAAALR
jgi:hypothetical protein